MLSEWYEYGTHCHITGMGQSGKSSSAEGMMREHILNDEPVWSVDRHGPSYDHMLKFCALVRPRRPVIAINPSNPEYIIPFNPFKLKGEISAHAMRQAMAIVKPWGEENSDEMPTYERLAQMLIHFMGSSHEPLHHAVRLLEMRNRELREFAISIIEDDFVRQQWLQLQYLSAMRSGFREWKYEVLSTQNRLMRFVASKSVKLFTGLPGEGFDVEKAYLEGAHVFINLTPSRFLSPQAGSIFAALFFSEWLNTALAHADKERPIFGYLDECQTYVTSDVADMLDQVLKCGTRLTLIHHHLGQFEDHHLIESIKTNAQIKLVFAGLPPAHAKEAAEEFFIHELNQRWKKEDRVHYVTEHELEESVTTGESKSVSRGKTETTGKTRAYAKTFGHGKNTFAAEHESSGKTWFEGDSFTDTVTSSSSSGMSGDEETSSDTAGESSGFSHSSGWGGSVSKGNSWGRGESWAKARSAVRGTNSTRGTSFEEGESHSVQRGTRYKPVVKRIVDGQEDFPREEKLSMLAERLMSLKKAECWVKLPDTVYKWKVPWVEPVLLNKESVIRFLKERGPKAIPLHEAEEILRREEDRFLKRSQKYESHAGRSQKRPPRLHPQE
jgi:hypothetical protein